MSKDLKKLKMKITGMKFLRRREELVQRPCGRNMPYGLEMQEVVSVTQMAKVREERGGDEVT